MKAKLIKTDSNYYLYVDGKIIASTEFVEGKQKLSKQNCDEIFGVVDVEELTEEGWRLQEDRNINKGASPHSYMIGFKEGFNKAMELNKDKVFTEEDMHAMFILGFSSNMNKKLISEDDWSMAKKFIQSLQQPSEVEVEIEMGDTPIWEDADVQGHVVCKKCGEWLESQIKPYTCKCINKPKLDSEGCLILKKI